MTTNAKFLFDTEFDPTAAEEPAAAKARAKPKPQYTDDDLAAARGEGQKTGFDLGTRHALEGIEKAAADALERIAEHIGHLGGAHERAVVNIRTDAARLAFSIADRLAAGLLAREPLGEIETLIGECLERLQAEPRIVIRVADDLVEPLHARIAQLSTSAGFGGKIVLIGEPRMAVGDCRVEWPDGGAERDMATLTDAAGEAVQRYLGLQAEMAETLPDAATPPAGDADTAAPDAAAPAAVAETAAAADDIDPDDPLASDALPAVAGLPDVPAAEPAAAPPAADE